MKKLRYNKFILFAIMLYAIPLIGFSQNCEQGHWIQKNINNGKFIQLEDGSLWEVQNGDEIYSMLWLPVSSIIVCGSTLINTDDGEQVEGIKVRSANNLPETNTKAETYKIDVSNDEVLVINGEIFEAKTYCLGFNKGDEVLFIKGSPFGACASAEILKLSNGKTCRLWCE